MRTIRLVTRVLGLTLALVAVFLPLEVPRMAGSYPALEVSFAPGIASSDVPSGGDWVDISSYVASVETVTGRGDEFTGASAGQMDLNLDNLDGRFDPDNASGPYYGQLLPLTWFRFRAGSASVTDDAFYGQVSIEGFQMTASAFPGTVQVEVLDFEQLAKAELPSSVWEIQAASMSPLSWWRLGESSGTVMVDSSGNGHHGAYLNGETFDSRTSLVDGSEDGAIFFDEGDGLAAAEGGGGYVSLVERPTAAVTAYPFSLAFWFDGDATPASPLSAGKVVWWQLPSGEGNGGITVQHTGSAGSASGTVDDGFLVLISDSTGNRRNWHTPGSLFDGNAHFVTLTITDPTAVTGSYDGESISMTNYSSAGGTPAMPGALEQRVGVGLNNSITLDEIMVFDSVIDTTEAADLYAAGHEPWSGELTSDRVTHLLDAVGFPATLRTIDTGQSTMPAAELSGDLLSALLDVAEAERGDLYIDHHDSGKVRFRDRHAKWTDSRSASSQATFGDGGGAEVPYATLALQDDRIINSYSGQRSGGAKVIVEDSASITQYQVRSTSETGLLLEDDSEVEARGNLTVAEKKDRHRRVRSITLQPLADTDLAWAQVFVREIGDRITIKWRPLYGGTYSWDAWIIGIRHTFDASVGRLETVFSLMPVPYGATAEPYFIVGTSTVSGPARIGY